MSTAINIKYYDIFEQFADKYKELHCCDSKIFTKKTSDVFEVHRAAKHKTVNRVVENHRKNPFIEFKDLHHDR